MTIRQAFTAAWRTWVVFSVIWTCIGIGCYIGDRAVGVKSTPTDILYEHAAFIRSLVAR